MPKRPEIQHRFLNTKIHFRLRARASGPEIVRFGGLSSSRLAQNTLEKVGDVAPYLFQWGLREGTVQTAKNRRCRIVGAVWPLILWISGGFRPPGAVATDIRADSTSIRY